MRLRRPGAQCIRGVRQAAQRGWASPEATDQRQLSVRQWRPLRHVYAHCQSAGQRQTHADRCSSGGKSRSRCNGISQLPAPPIRHATRKHVLPTHKAVHMLNVWVSIGRSHSRPAAHRSADVVGEQQGLQARRQVVEEPQRRACGGVLQGPGVASATLHGEHHLRFTRESAELMLQRAQRSTAQCIHDTKTQRGMLYNLDPGS